MSGGVPPSSRGKRAPRGGDDLERAADLFERFTGHDATRADRLILPPRPRALMLLGDLDGVLYTAVRDGEVERYIHEFTKRDRPQLASSPDGLQLYIVGGAYRVTSLGIVDASDRKHRNAR
jgi:hypothetical protein